MSSMSVSPAGSHLNRISTFVRKEFRGLRAQRGANPQGENGGTAEIHVAPPVASKRETTLFSMSNVD